MNKNIEQLVNSFMDDVIDQDENPNVDVLNDYTYKYHAESNSYLRALVGLLLS
jgi:hypothetical protein